MTGLSPYHWHRVYRELQGETIHATLSRLRLQRAAKLLGDGELPLGRVARRAGYGSLPAFSRAFRAAYGMPPGAYRATGPHRRYRADLAATDATPSGAPTPPVEVRDEPARRCACVPHAGRYLEIDRAFSTLHRALARAGVDDASLDSLGVYFDDPSLIEPRRLESLACAAGLPDDRVPEGLDRWEIPAGPHAVLLHRGPFDALDEAYRWMFGRWLPASGREPADAPVHERYLDDPRTTAPMELRVEIRLPLAG